MLQKHLSVCTPTSVITISQAWAGNLNCDTLVQLRAWLNDTHCMRKILQYKCFRSWLHDATTLDKHLCFCFDVAKGINMKISELD